MPNRDSAKTSPTIAHHREHPEISVEEHFLAKSIERAALVKARQSVYLDTNFWIKLREAALGRPKEPDDLVLYLALRAAVRNRKVICPFASEMYLEFMQIGDLTKRQAGAKIVDELSLGVTLRVERERILTELEDFVRRTGQLACPHAAADLMWTCPGYAVGFLIPGHTSFDAVTELALQKAFMDHLYTLGYADQDRLLGETPSRVKTGEDLAAKMNQLNQAHADEMRSLKQVTTTEFRGALDFHLPTIERALRNIAEDELQSQFSPADIEAAKSSAQKVALILAKLFEQNRLGAYVPTLAIRAALHAAVRWDRSRRYKKNDFRDFGHAVSALPYFDVFATERSLVHLAASQLKLDRRYQTTLVRKPRELLALVAAL